MLEVRQARYFIAVAEELHFGRAAERLHMSQSPLSQAIKSLEAQLGVVLLVRTRRSVALTDTGRIVLERCYDLVTAARRAEETAEFAASGRVGRLRIAAGSLALADLLPAIVARYRRELPEVELKVKELDSAYAAAAVFMRECDAAFVRGVHTDPRLRIRKLTSDEFVAVIPAGTERDYVDRDDHIPLSALRDSPWAWISRSSSPFLHDDVIAACHSAGFTPDLVHEARTIPSQLDIVRCGLGVCLAPKAAVRHERGLTYRPLAVSVPTSGLSIVVRLEDDGPLISRLVEVAGECVGDI
ncbi:LysR substrate-binding domain-containing protein [Rhodococcus wratislaviensis]|uniref:LysR substrate-binding domain-containing protein n=1 Tax=Rhodococcus wratislaviensis TaxID=44752 RepID=UPI0035145FFC